MIGHVVRCHIEYTAACLLLLLCQLNSYLLSIGHFQFLFISHYVILVEYQGKERYKFQFKMPIFCFVTLSDPEFALWITSSLLLN